MLQPKILQLFKICSLFSRINHIVFGRSAHYLFELKCHNGLYIHGYIHVKWLLRFLKFYLTLHECLKIISLYLDPPQSIILYITHYK